MIHPIPDNHRITFKTILKSSLFVLEGLSHEVGLGLLDECARLCETAPRHSGASGVNNVKEPRRNV